MATLVLCVASAAYTSSFLKFKTDRFDLIDPNAEYQQRWLSYAKTFDDQSDLVVAIEGKSPEAIEAAIEDVGRRMEEEPAVFAHVLYKIDTRELRSKGLQYLTAAQLQELSNRLGEFGPVLSGHSELVNLKTIFQGLRSQVEKEGAAADPAASEPVLQMADRVAASVSHFVDHPEEYRSPWEDLVGIDAAELGAGDADANAPVRYFLNEKKSMGFVLAQPTSLGSGFDGPVQAIDRLRELIRRESARFPDVRIGLTGMPVLESDEMRSSQTAMYQASVISFVGVALLFMIGFRGIRHPLLAMLMLVVGTIWTFGFTTFAVGHLNILSVSFVSILVGLGDFWILYVTRYLAMRHEGSGLRPALGQTAAEVGPGILTAAATTSIAFFCAIFTEFRGVAELGIITGGGILLCTVAAFTVLPALISLADRHREARKLPTPFEAKLLRRITTHYPVPVVIGALLLIVGIGIFGFRVKYDDNLLHMQADGVDSVEVQKRIAAECDDRLLFALSIAPSREQALEQKRRFEQLPTVHHVTEIASFLPQSPSDETLPLVAEIRAALAHLPDSSAAARPADPLMIESRLDEFAQAIADIDTSAASQTREHLAQLTKRLETLPLDRQVALLTAYQRDLATDLMGRLRDLRAATSVEPIRISDLPAALTTRFISRGPDGVADGKLWALQIYPQEDIWDVEPLGRFVKELRSVDPEVTGIPLQTYEASREIRHSYEMVALYALLAVYLVLLIDLMPLRRSLAILMGPLAALFVAGAALRLAGIAWGLNVWAPAYLVTTLVLVALTDITALRNTVLALMPPLVGAALMLGCLGLMQVDLNPANLIVLPLIVGIGVDSGVHLLHDYRAQGRTYGPSASIVNSVILTSLTTMMGFGSMMVAAHRGLKSLGLVLTVGVASCTFVSLVLLPAILTLISWRGRRGGSQRFTHPTDERPFAAEAPHYQLHAPEKVA